jgi:hypothetical protein
MSAYQEPYSAPFGSGQPSGVVDVRKLWTGGVITAVIVFGLAIAGFLFVHGILNYPILGIRPGGAVVRASMFGYASGAALVALLATAGMHILLLSAPRPMWYFGWIAGVGTAVAGLLPLVLPQDLTARLATATINLVLGLAITRLVSGTAAASFSPAGSSDT